MSINGLYQFNTLITKNGKIIDLENVDIDKDGKISQQEFNLIQQELCMDTLELTDEQQQKDEKNVSDFEFVLWNQEAHMQNSFNNLCVQVSKDFIGVNSKHSPQVLKELRMFLSDFEEEYLSSGESIINMSAKFDEMLLLKYEEIKQELLAQ